jgi:tripartite ATP-independent transporter DctM subunit
MSNAEIGLLSIAGIVVLIQSGMHVAVALGLLSFVSVWAVKGDVETAGHLLFLSAQESIASYAFGVIPLFTLMGLLVSVSGIADETFELANRAFGRIRGGLGIATVAANAAFAAVTGTSIASASVFTKVAVPQMVQRGYTRRYAVGVVAGSSVLGMLIPPSFLMIIYGIITETSIGQLFTGGILPGLLLAGTYAGLTMLLAVLAPRFIFADGKNALAAEHGSGRRAWILGLPVVALIVLVLGGIYGGIFTPTEAGGVGALGALVLALTKRRLDAPRFRQVLRETGEITAAISFLIITAHMYARMLALSGLPGVIGGWIEGAGLGLYGFLAIYLLILLVMGMFLDSVSILLIMVPLVLPVVDLFGVSDVWFGVVNIVAVEIGLLTPPLGIACFVVRANLAGSDVDLNDVFAGAIPFAVTMALVLLALVAFPGIVTALI